MIQYRKIIVSIVLCAILLGTSGVIAQLLYATRTQPARREAHNLAPVVETVFVKQQDLVERFVGYGTARSDRVAELAAEVAATVIERVADIEEGSTVSTNQPLIQLDTREYRHLLEQADARSQADVAALRELAIEASKLNEMISTARLELEVTRAEKKRVSILYEQGHAAKKEYDFANLDYQQARRVLQGYELDLIRNEPRQEQLLASKRGYDAALALAELDLERCTIRAPFAGTIERLSVDIGDHVLPGSVLLTLVDPSHVEIPIQLPSAVHDRINLGAVVRLSSESMTHHTWVGRVARLAASADAGSRTFAVYIDVDNSKQSHTLLPGSFVSAEVEGVLHRQSLSVPRSAVRDGQLLVIEHEVAKVRRVDVIRLIGDHAIVVGDLRVGDQVITDYTNYLGDGSPVRGQLSVTMNGQPSSSKDISFAIQREHIP